MCKNMTFPVFSDFLENKNSKVQFSVQKKHLGESNPTVQDSSRNIT
jgi:hypothetical protein